MSQAGIQLPESDAWFLSCRLSRECALGGNWRGNGLPSFTDPACPLVLTCRVDFSDLAPGVSSLEKGLSGGLTFNVSVCGRFLLVAEGIMIYVYELIQDRLRAVTSIIAPMRVLAMSMDASAKRFAVAALLDGRMGMVCNIRAGRESLPPGSVVESNTGHQRDPHCSIFTTRLYPGDDRTVVHAQGSSTERIRSSDQPQVPSKREFTTVEVKNGKDKVALRGLDRPNLNDASWVNREWTTAYPHPAAPSEFPPVLPVESGSSTTYRYLCSDDDPPRSVAICPQRQCVAFGCSSGLELHWVDALTGQDLNRWFPLTGPSDFLYFLPPRRGVDSTRKLRLISSACHPAFRPAIARRFSIFNKSLIPGFGSFWGSIGLANRTPSLSGYISDCDHFRAVPLSDGFHVMFCDPDSEMLCVGSDAPLGDPRRLIRKIMLSPPDSILLQHDAATRKKVPRLYAASADVTKGPRIVAVYGDTLVLYSIPPDVFELSRKEQQIGAACALLTKEDVERAEWLNWWQKGDTPANYPKLPDTSTRGPKSIWPLFIRGTEFGELQNVVDVAISETNGLTVWAFALHGAGVAWRVDRGQRPHAIRECSVTRSGQVVNVHQVDRDGDVIMDDFNNSPMSELGANGDRRSRDEDKANSEVSLLDLPVIGSTSTIAERHGGGELSNQEVYDQRASHTSGGSESSGCAHLPSRERRLRRSHIVIENGEPDRSVSPPWRQTAIPPDYGDPAPGFSPRVGNVRIARSDNDENADEEEWSTQTNTGNTGSRRSMSVYTMPPRENMGNGEVIESFELEGEEAAAADVWFDEDGDVLMRDSLVEVEGPAAWGDQGTRGL